MRAPTKRPPGELTWADITGERDHDDDRARLLRNFGNALAIMVPAWALVICAVVGAVSLLP